jgi:RNA polymerase sigma factor (sigma-70 family)
MINTTKHAKNCNAERLTVLTPAQLNVLVAEIRQCNQQAIAEFYQLLRTGVRWRLFRQLRTPDADDYVHDVFLTVTVAIQNGALRDPERVFGYVNTIVNRIVCSVIAERVKERSSSADHKTVNGIIDRRSDSEQRLLHLQKVETMKQVLLSMSANDREILERFYVDEQTREEICSQMNLTKTQFRLAKSRAKAKFEEIACKKAKAEQVTKLARRIQGLAPTPSVMAAAAG